MKSEWDFFNAMLIATLVFFAFVVVSSISSFFIYKSDTFTATVIAIDYYEHGSLFGGKQVQVKFDDGRVYSMRTIPIELKENHAYTLEYQEPYVGLQPRIVIVEQN